MSGGTLWLSRNEKDTSKIADAVRQLMEGRSNATGTVTLSTGTTTTTVSAPTCGASSIIKLAPQTATAAVALATSFVKATDVTPSQFIITHASSSTTDRTFGWVALG